MNPRIPDLLSRVTDLAVKALERPSGDTGRAARRIEALEGLHDEAHDAMAWPGEESRRLVNDWTLMLIKAARIIERAAAAGEPDDLARATTVANVLLPYVLADCLTARTIAARPATSDHDFPTTIRK
jgi:hypothetical protein